MSFHVCGYKCAKLCLNLKNVFNIYIPNVKTN